MTFSVEKTLCVCVSVCAQTVSRWSLARQLARRSADGAREAVAPDRRRIVTPGLPNVTAPDSFLAASAFSPLDWKTAADRQLDQGDMHSCGEGSQKSAASTSTGGSVAPNFQE